MISNNYISELDIQFNTDYLRYLVLKGEMDPLKFQSLAENDSYLKEIANKYNFLSSKYNTYFLKPGDKLPIHIDAKRNCAINIPLMNVKNSYTIFYNHLEEPNLEYDSVCILNKVNSKVEEVFKFNLTVPTLVNTSVPHSAVNFGNETRIIISWSVKPEYMFEDIKKLLSTV